jgi:hypothetical protein
MSSNSCDQIDVIIDKIPNKKEVDFDEMSYSDNDTFLSRLKKDKKPKKGSILKKSNLLFLNNGWNENNEKIIISIGENAASYKWMHERNAMIKKRTSNIINILLIFLSTVLSADTILGYAQEDTKNEVIIILIKIVIYIINILSVLQQFLRLEEESSQHMTYANSFIRLYHDIQQQMSMYRIHRLNASKYISECVKRYDSLVVKGPKINSFIINKFKKKFDKSDISLPEIADKIQKIEIIQEPTIYNNDEKSEKKIDLHRVQHTSNLKTINNIFKVKGDLSDNEISELNPDELKELRKNFLNAKSEFEYRRYLQHNLEFD